MNLLDSLKTVKTPCYVVDEGLIIKNMEVLKRVQTKTGCKILLAQKAFSMYELYPLMSKYLSGTTASGLHEARLGKEHFGGETHVYSPAYKEDEFDEILKYSDHIVFNSFDQWEKYKEKSLSAGKVCGIRVNPECSTQEGHEIYDPCAPFSRLGTTRESFKPDLLDGISGLHFHTLCEQNSDDLEKTLKVFEEKFGEFLPQMKWVNFGGGHHITREDYNIQLLERCIAYFKEKYDVEVYLEPGEAAALNAGFLVTSVVDTMKNGMDIALLDASAACHMPDVLEMPYRPEIIGAKKAGENPYTYRLAGITCLAGDVIGDYSFNEKLKAGDKLIFCDMAIYSMVKNNTFNGMNLPDIAVRRQNGEIEVLKSFGYEDFKSRL